MEIIHKPVLLEKILEYLPQKRSGWLVDATLGGGGYSRAFLDKGFKVIAFEKDQERVDQLNEMVGQSFQIVNASYVTMSDQLFLKNIKQVDAIIFDLGVSSYQLDSIERGFSWKDRSSLLDMRMDLTQELTAADILNSYPETEISMILKTYGEEAQAKRLAREIYKRREKNNFETSGDLIDILQKVYSWKLTNRIIARNFQALRIAVNDELKELELTLEQVYSLLVPGGRLLAVSFHSLEDRIIKSYLQKMSRGCICPPSFPICKCGNKPKFKILSKKPITADDDEVITNIRSRSAKMRIGEKI